GISVNTAVLLAALRSGAIGLQPRHGDLHADNALSLFHQVASRLFNIFKRLSRCMPVSLDSFAALAAKYLINRHSRTLAENVPQCHVDTADRVPEDWTVTPIRADEV